MNRLRAGQRDVGEVHRDDLRPGVLYDLRSRRAHPARGTDDKSSLAVVAESVE